MSSATRSAVWSPDGSGSGQDLSPPIGGVRRGATRSTDALPQQHGGLHHELAPDGLSNVDGVRGSCPHPSVPDEVDPIGPAASSVRHALSPDRDHDDSQSKTTLEIT